MMMLIETMNVMTAWILMPCMTRLLSWLFRGVRPIATTEDATFRAMVVKLGTDHRLQSSSLYGSFGIARAPLAWHVLHPIFLGEGRESRVAYGL